MTLEILQNGARDLGITLTLDQLEQFEIYYRELADWNERVNLTSITAYEKVQAIHFLDSLSVTQALDPKSGNLRVIDVGSGAGLPGLPLKIAFPDLKLALLDSTANKTGFLTHLTKTLGMDDVEILTGRAEEFARRIDYREMFDVVLSRGVAPLAVLVELTLPFCAVGGCLIAQKKGDIENEIKDSQNAIFILGGELTGAVPVNLAGLDDDRKLVVIQKISATPLKYPRRSGMPGKRPLK